MLRQYFYHNQIRKYVTLFGTVFNDLHIQRKDASNTIVQSIAVPIAYAPKERALVRLTQDPNLDERKAILLPRMSFEMTAFIYDPTRKHQSTGMTRLQSPDKQRAERVFNPVPWNVGFALYVFTKSQDEANQIIEQIIPYFTPDLAFTLELIPEMNIKVDCPITLNGVTTEDTYEGDFEQSRRMIITTFDFTMRCNFYGPINNFGVIKQAQIDLAVVQGGNTFAITDEDIARTGRSVRIITTPGLTANGEPTTNSALSISPSLISADDPYDYCVDITDYFDGLKYNPVTDQDEPTDA